HVSHRITFHVDWSALFRFSASRVLASWCETGSCRGSISRQDAKSRKVATRSGQIPDLMSPVLAMRMIWSEARYASAWIVHVGCPRPDVTKLLPSQMKRLETS